MGAGALAAPDAPVPLDGLAAVVNGETITVGDALNAAPSSRQRGGPPDEAAGLQSLEELQRQRNAAVRTATEDLVARKLVLDAFKADGGAIPDWVVERQINETVRERFNNSRSKLEQALRADGLSIDDMRRNVRERVIFQSMKSTKVSQAVRVTPLDVRAHYEGNRAKYAAPAEVRLRLLMLDGGGTSPSAAQRDLAADLRQRIAKGEDFAALAKQYSTDAQAAQGGDWGWVNPRNLRQELAAAIEGLTVGAVSAVVEVGASSYLIRLEERREARVRPFGEVEAAIERELREAQSRALFDRWIASLRDRAYVKVNDVRPN